MRLAVRLFPKTITGQITSLVVAAVLLGIGVIVVAVLLLLGGTEGAKSSRRGCGTHRHGDWPCKVRQISTRCYGSA